MIGQFRKKEKDRDNVTMTNPSTPHPGRQVTVVDYITALLWGEPSMSGKKRIEKDRESYNYVDVCFQNPKTTTCAGRGVVNSERCLCVKPTSLLLLHCVHYMNVQQQ
jgi:hypothetical protein